MNISFEDAIIRVIEELKKEGIGILTTIDVQDTLKKKLNVDLREYTILGACNHPFAHEVLKADDSMGLLMPCNVVVQEKQGSVIVSIFNTEMLKSFTSDDHIIKLTEQLKAKLNKVINQL